MTTAISSYVLIIELGADNDQKPRVLRRFDHHRTRNTVLDRVTKGRNKDEDVEMADADADDASRYSEEDDSKVPLSVNILRIAVSADGQWVATSDDHSRTHVFNLDSIQVCHV